MGRIAARDLAASVPGLGRGDEIGAMASAVQIFRDNMIRADELAAAEVADRAAKEARAARLATLVSGFEAESQGIAGILSSSATQLQETAQAISATATRTNDRATTVAASAEQASAGVQTARRRRRRAVDRLGQRDQPS